MPEIDATVRRTQHCGNLEVPVPTSHEVALDYRAGPGDGRRNSLPSPPRQISVGIVMPKVLKVNRAIRRALRHDHFKVAVFPRSEVALDNAARSHDPRRNALPGLPRKIGIRVIVKVVPEVLCAVGDE